MSQMLRLRLLPSVRTALSRLLSSHGANGPEVSIHDHKVAELHGFYGEVFVYRIHFLRSGHGKQNLLLFPGPMESAMINYAQFLQRLDKERFTAIAFDPPGYGKSTPPSRDWDDPEILLNDARIGIQLMYQLNKFPFACLGWSEGASSALFAALHTAAKGYVEKLVIWSKEENGCPQKDLNWQLHLRALYGSDYFEQCWKLFEKNRSILKRPESLQIISHIPVLQFGSFTNLHLGDNCINVEWPLISSSSTTKWMAPHTRFPIFFQQAVETFLTNHQLS